MNAAERVVRRVDTFQQSRRPLAFAFAVVKKFGDDRGGSLAALITYNAFIAVFPLLLLLTTVLGFVIDKNSGVRQSIINSTLRDFPIVGNQLVRSVHPLRGSPIALIVGLIGLVWGSMGLSQAAQYAMAETWNIRGEDRPGFFPRMLRGLAMLGVLGLGLGLTTSIASIAALVPSGIGTWVLVPLGTVAVNIGLFAVGFRVLTPSIPTRNLLPGAIVGGVGWSALQIGGALLVDHNLRHASQVYGYFASVLGLISWLFLSAQLALYASEINVVRARKLWPRSIVQPPLTDADKRALDDIAEQGKRRPEQTVESAWTPS